MEDKPLPEPVYYHENELSAGEGFSIIDRFLHSTAKDTASVELNASTSVSTESLQQDAEYLQPNDNAQESGAISLSQNEGHFSLDYVSYLNQTMPQDVESETSMPGQDLIDAFLSNSPQAEVKTVRLKHEMSDKLDLNNTADDDFKRDTPSVADLPEDTFTETLAKIYLKQKRYDHALEIFRSLSLKYPEKNVYFADQIRFLEKLIINIKNN